MLERQSVVFLHDFESLQTLRLLSVTGQLRPAFCTAEGQCLVAGYRRPQVEEFANFPMPRRTTKTITDKDEFVRRIKRVESGSDTPLKTRNVKKGTRCVAAPIYNAEGRIVASVGVAGPRARIKKIRKSRHLRPVVIEAANQVSATHGLHAPPADLRLNRSRHASDHQSPRRAGFRLRRGRYDPARSPAGRNRHALFLQHGVLRKLPIRATRRVGPAPTR